MRQQEGQWIRYRFNIAAQLRVQELSCSPIQAECWGSLVCANVFKEFDHGEMGQKSWLWQMAACPFYLRREEELFCWVSMHLQYWRTAALYVCWFPRFTQNKWHQHAVCVDTSVGVIFATTCWFCGFCEKNPKQNNDQLKTDYKIKAT